MQKLQITKPRFGKQSITFPIIGKTEIEADNSFEVSDEVNAEELKAALEGSNIFIELPEPEQEPEGSETHEPEAPEVEPIKPMVEPTKDETPAEEPVKNEEPVKEEEKPSKEELIEMINALDKKEMLEYIKTEMPDTISMQKAGPLGEEKLRALIISSL